MRTPAIVSAALLLLLSGCGGKSGSETTTEPATTVAAQPAAKKPPVTDREPLRHAHCPAAAGNCRTAEGTILYVERVDPDGDGDAHFVLLSADNVTGPGLSVIDVARDLRPHPLPGYGDRVSAAGPVYTGHYGQRQIQATEVFTAPG
jgi:hypothetical protein